MKGWGKNFVTRVEILLNFFLIYNHRRIIFLCKSDGSYFFVFVVLYIFFVESTKILHLHKRCLKLPHLILS